MDSKRNRLSRELANYCGILYAHSELELELELDEGRRKIVGGQHNAERCMMCTK